LEKEKLRVKFSQVGGVVFLGKGFGQRAGCLTKRAQMKWEVKGEEEIANKKTNQTENSSARLSWG